jgi:hypothetical protein
MLVVKLLAEDLNIGTQEASSFSPADKSQSRSEFLRQQLWDILDATL